MGNAAIVIDLGFGDGGKGLVVDNICSRYRVERRVEKPLVVRFSGGQQAGHTVMTEDGTKHIFSSFGAGTLAGSRSFFTEDTTVWLPSLLREFDVLKEKGYLPSLAVHPLAMLTTPFDVAYNRAMEFLRAGKRHGSCGLGVGTTMKRCIETPYKTYVGDLEYKPLLYEKVYAVHKYYLDLLKDNAVALSFYHAYSKDLIDQFSDAVDSFAPCHFSITHEPIVTRDVIFEGSQGVMLDMDHGVFPNVTYGNTTCKNAMKYVQKWNMSPQMWYVTRCYTTRHGAGWMPNDEEGAFREGHLINNEEEINVHNDWQREFRIREFDYEMIENSRRINSIYSGKCTSESLVITCLDQRPDFTVDQNRLSPCNLYLNHSARRGHMKKKV